MEEPEILTLQRWKKEGDTYREPRLGLILSPRAGGMNRLKLGFCKELLVLRLRELTAQIDIKGRKMYPDRS